LFLSDQGLKDQEVAGREKGRSMKIMIELG
jgi:hypothetical protein